MTCRVKKFLVVFLLILLLIGFVYCIFASFSEHREYKKLSIDYWLLTPTEITDIAAHCSDAAHFIYSAADGPKPLVVQLSCSLNDVDVIQYVERAGFVTESSEHYRNDQKELVWVRDAEGKTIGVTLLTFL